MVTSDNSGKMKDVKATSGSGFVLLRASARTLGDIERRKLALQTTQSVIGPRMDGLRGIYQPKV
jgi:hypothetical protein